MAKRRSYRQADDTVSVIEAFDGLRSDYDAARTDRLHRRRHGIPGSGANADFHYRSERDYLLMMEVARDMDRNDRWISQGINRACNNHIQQGFALEPKTPDAKLNLDLWQRFEDWATDPKQCDAAGRFSLHRLAWFAFRAVAVDGDHLLVGTESGALESYEGHRIRSPLARSPQQEKQFREIVNGVLVGRFGQFLRYYVTESDIDPWASSPAFNKFLEIPPTVELEQDYGLGTELQVAFHLMNPKRTSQRRGVTAFAPIIRTAGFLEDIEFAKTVQQQIVSCIAFIRTKTLAAEGFGVNGAKPLGEQTEGQWSGGGVRLEEKISPGMQIRGEPGESIQGFSPNVPNPEYQTHLKGMLTVVALNFGMPLVQFLMDAGETNFSGWRGAMDEARRNFKFNQHAILIEQFYSPVYRWKLHQFIAGDPALARAAKKHGRKLFDHQWNAPTWNYIQPKEDAEADGVRLKERLASHRILCDEQGRDWDDLSTWIVEDNAILIEKALERRKQILVKYPDADLDFRELMGTSPDKKAADKEKADNTERMKEKRANDA